MAEQQSNEPWRSLPRVFPQIVFAWETGDPTLGVRGAPPTTPGKRIDPHERLRDWILAAGGACSAGDGDGDDRPASRHPVPSDAVPESGVAGPSEGSAGHPEGSSGDAADHGAGDSRGNQQPGPPRMSFWRLLAAGLHRE